MDGGQRNGESAAMKESHLQPTVKPVPRAAAGLLLAASILAACGGDAGVAPSASAGELEVTVATAGLDQDADGYAVDVDGEGRAVGPNGTVTFTDLEPGSRMVELSGVQANCAVAGENPRAVAVTGGAKATTRFDVACLDAVIDQIAFTSERDDPQGEIYLLNVDGPGVTRLSNNPGADIFPAVSPDGTKILFTSARAAPDPADLYVMNADGSNVTRLTTEGFNRHGVWSRDGSRIAFTSNRDGNDEVYVMNADGSVQVNLTKHAAQDMVPHWSPDGTRIVFQSDRDGNNEIYVMNRNGSNLINLTNPPAADELPRWSPDGSRILFITNRDGNYELYLMDPDGSNLVNVTNHPAYDAWGDWSPDGSRIAFESNRGGNLEIYVMGASGTFLVKRTDHAALDRFPSWGLVR